MQEGGGFFKSGSDIKTNIEMTEILFRLLREDDIDAVNTFYNNYHNAGRTRDKFNWEFNESPHGKGIYILAVNTDTGSIIGIQAGIPVILINAEGKEVLTVKSEDTLIDVDACAAFRRRDVFKELYGWFFEECRRRGVAYVWGFTWVVKSLKRVGCEIPFRAGQKIMVLEPLLSYGILSKLNSKNTFREKALIMMMVWVAWIKGFQGRLPQFHRAGFKINEEILDNTGLFREAAGKEQLFFIRQDEPYLRWRIEQNPYTLDYHLLNFMKDDRMMAQVIFSINAEGQAFIEQILYSAGLGRRAKKNIIVSVIGKLKKMHAAHVRFMVFEANKINREESELLDYSGFLNVKPGMGVLFKNLDETETVKPEQIVFSRLYTQGHA